LTGPARRIAGLLIARGVEGASVLEVGGGVGALQLELLRAGAARTVDVELSSEYEPWAIELARRASLEGRIERRIADFVAASAEIEPADDVVMNRVVCCYPDPDALVGTAADRTRRLLVMSFPREHAINQIGFAAANAWFRLRGTAFRAFVHPTRAVLSAAERRGLRLVHEERSFIWQIAALERPGDG
jgi:magnesium-protoporphyrin O-methyltransferase